MAYNKLRRKIAWEAARLMYSCEEAEYVRAKHKASRRVAADRVRPRDLPTHREIRDQLRMMAQHLDEGGRADNLRLMRLKSLEIMRLLAAFHPRLIGSTPKEHTRRGTALEIHVFAENREEVCAVLESHGILYEICADQVSTRDREAIPTHVRCHVHYPFTLTIYPRNMVSCVFRSAATGQAIQRTDITELECMLAERSAESLDERSGFSETSSRLDRFHVYESLLLPLENVKESRKHHPEGDALYHSLQVFDLARDELPYDEEFLLAALLHDVGKAIDRADPTTAGLEALDGVITPRCRWLIEHHTEGHEALAGTLGARHRRRLQESEDYEALLLLAQCDAVGRQRGVQTPDLEEALDYLRELATMCGDGSVY